MTHILVGEAVAKDRTEDVEEVAKKLPKMKMKKTESQV